MEKNYIAQLCRRMATACLFLIIGVLLIGAITWIFLVCMKYAALFEPLVKNKELFSGIDFKALSVWRLFGALVVISMPILVMAYGFYLLRVLFQHYAQGEYFSSVAVNQLGRISKVIAWWVVMGFMSEILSSVLLNENISVSEKIVDAVVNSGTITAMFLSGFFSVIALILQRASEIEAENRQFL